MVSVSPVLPAVSDSAASIRARMAAEKRSRAPTTFKRILLRCRRSTSRSSVTKNNSIRKLTSSSGRRQFSVENANRVRYSTPSSEQAFTVSRTASRPRLWPATRGRKRFLAQRPLPSIMMAMCRGTARTSGTSCVELANKGRPLYSHQFGFFGGQCLVDLGSVLVGQLLDVVLAAALFVLGNGLVLEQVLEVVISVATNIAYGYTCAF